MKKLLYILLVTLLLLTSLPAFAEETESAPAWQAYNGKRIGVLTGPLMEDIAHKYFPNSEYMLFNSYPDCISALLAGKIDAFLGDEPGMKSLHAEQPQIDYIRERLSENYYCFAFRKDDPKNTALLKELNEFIKRCWADGTMQELEDIWLGVNEDRKVVDMSDLTGANGTIRVVTTSTDMPYSYIKDGKNVGYDIDLVVRFCREKGYALELGDVDFAGRIPAVQSGKYDFSTDMNRTPEREEQVLFSEPVSSGGVVLAILSKDLSPEPAVAAKKSVTLDDLEDKRIGIPSGTNFDRIIKNRFPQAKLLYFNNQSDLLTALAANKIDAFPSDEPVIRYIMNQRKDVTYIPDHLEDFEFAYCFAKTSEGQRLCKQFSEFIAGLKADGRLDALETEWFSGDESIKTMPDIAALSAENGVLRLATDGDYMPFEYMRDGQVVGYDIDIAAEFCKAYGYGLKIEVMNLDAVLPSVQSGKCSFGASAITITPERSESVLFSEPNYTGGTVMVVLKTQEPDAAVAAEKTDTQQDGFWGSLVTSFQKTFIRESRWKLFLEGIGNTMLITVLSILFGTLLGFLVFLLCRNGSPVANGTTRFSMWLVQGMPMVVLLMILYYVIFGSVAINGIAVAVIGFTLTFGSAVFGLIKMGVGFIDRGQYEAAYALGHSKRHTFFKIILPQAIPHVLPAYQGEIVGLIKATAIVGYIAVQDLTKMGDIVRSRTYEAFFPLIAIAVIYFVLEGLFSFAVSRIRVRTDPKRRKRDKILKGVKEHDQD